MNNYEYIIASLPVLKGDSTEETRAESLIEEIRSQLSPADTLLLDILLDSAKEEKMNADFYVAGRKCRSAFLRSYLEFDRGVRNAKARYLNKALGRPDEMDVISLDEEEEEFEWNTELSAILGGSDILGRERALDELMWRRIEELSVFDWFDMDAILAFTAKLQIVDRWLALDENTGREMFRRLVEELRSSSGGIKFEA